MCRKLIYLTSFVLVLVLTGFVQAELLVNPGFEDPVLAEDDWTWLDVPGWTQVGGDGPGIWNVTLADFDPVIAPEGENVLYTENAPAGVANGVAQVLTETFAANTDYTLTAEVGNSWAYYYAGYSVQLLAGGIVIAEDNDTLWPEYYKWATSTVVYTYDPADSALVGQPLEIRLLNLGLDKDPSDTVGVEFDNVTLTSVAGAEPGITIPVDPNSDLAAANALANPGDTIAFAAGMYAITGAIEIKDGVTYQGAGSGQTIIDCGGVTRAFVGWGDRSQNDDLPYSETGYPANTSGPKDWVIQGLSIINGVADDANRSVLRVGDPDVNDPPLTVNEVLNPDKSANGGGILLENGAEGALIDVAFDNCNALATELDTSDPNNPTTTYLGNGGAVRMSSSTANILDCSFTNNNAAVDGGAVSATNPDMENWDLIIENSTFTNNRCRDDGGAIAVVRRNLSVINCVGDGNKTGLDPNTLESDITSTPDGGFLWITGASKVAGTSYTDDTPPLEVTNYGGVVTVSGCTITNGEGRRGGGIRSDRAAQLFVTESSFTNCSATGHRGGAIYANSPSPLNPAVVDVNDPDVGEPGVFIDGVTFDGCTAADDGGGITVDNFGTGSGSNFIEFPKVVISNSVVANCRAGGPAPDDGDRRGGGIYLNAQLNVTITNTVVDNCTAGQHGAGIMIDGTCNSVIIDGVRVSNCSNDNSDDSGDGVALCMDQDNNAFVIVANCIFDNNISIQDDGVVRIDGDVIYVANCTFVGNTAADKGILYFGTSHDDPEIVTNKAVNNLFVNNDSSPGSDNTINWAKDNNNNITLNNIFFGTILDGDSEIEDTADGDLGPNGNFIATADPLADTAGGDYHLAAGSEAIDAGTAEDAPDHDIDGASRPQGAAHDVGAYESPAN